MTARYRWDSPHDWLAERARKWDAAQLYYELTELAAHLDSDTIQDEYQAEMAADGYFTELPEPHEGGANR